MLTGEASQITDRKQIVWGLPSRRSKNKLMWLADCVVPLSDMYECAKVRSHQSER